jgi:uncharacterized protein (DUF4415 family)
MIRKEIKNTISREQMAMLEALKDREPVPDEEIPELTDEELSQFRRISEIKREERRKQTVTLRLSPQAFNKAKSLGKGYTSVLGRILEEALNDPKIVGRNL